LDQYLAPVIAGLVPINPHTFMLVVGAIEVVAGIIVALKPSVGGRIAAVWVAVMREFPLITPRSLVQSSPRNH
jgi:hypothetical protein